MILITKKITQHSDEKQDELDAHTLRQDGLVRGIIPNQSEKDLYLIAAQTTDYGKNSSQSSKYDVMLEQFSIFFSLILHLID